LPGDAGIFAKILPTTAAEIFSGTRMRRLPDDLGEGNSIFTGLQAVPPDRRRFWKGAHHRPPGGSNNFFGIFPYQADIS